MVNDLSGDIYGDLSPFLEIAGSALSDPHRPTRTQEAYHTTRHASEISKQISSVARAGNMTVKKRVKSLGEKLIPISPEFYDTEKEEDLVAPKACLLYTSPSPRDGLLSRMPSSA